VSTLAWLRAWRSIAAIAVAWLLGTLVFRSYTLLMDSIPDPLGEPAVQSLPMGAEATLFVPDCAASLVIRFDPASALRGSVTASLSLNQIGGSFQTIPCFRHADVSRQCRAASGRSTRRSLSCAAASCDYGYVRLTMREPRSSRGRRGLPDMRGSRSMTARCRVVLPSRARCPVIAIRSVASPHGNRCHAGCAFRPSRSSGPCGCW
jgi:hypothetical protein